MNVPLRLLQDRDIDEADAVLRAAFCRDISFQKMLRLHRRIAPDGFWIAEDAGRIIGTVGFTDYGQLAYVALMSVLPKLQGRGLGRRLMDHVLAQLDKRRCDMTLLDATAAGSALYEKLGFIEDALAYEFSRPDTRASDPSQATDGRHDVLRADDLGQIVAFDAPLFGADRSRLFQGLWDEYRHRCLVACDEQGRIRGYLFAKETVLGPWAACDPVTAERLLSAALRFPFEGTPTVLAPRSNQHSIALLNRFGFVPQRTLRHMRRGGSGPPGKADQLYGQSSFGHG